MSVDGIGRAAERGRKATPPRRTRQRDAGATRHALLSMAVLEFAEKGFAGARVDVIANRAGVNKQLLYHHFGNKDDLYRVVLELVYSEIRENERALQLGDMAPAEAMRTLVGYSFDYLVKHPEFIKLVSDENAQGAPHAATSRDLTEMHSPLVQMLRETLEKGAKANVFRDDMDPINVYISIAGLSFFYFSNNPTLSAIFGKTLSSPEAIAARRAHVIEFAMAALQRNQPVG